MKKAALLVFSAIAALTVSSASASAATNPTHHKAQEHKMHAKEHKMKAAEHKLHAKEHKAREHKMHAKSIRPHALPQTGNGGMSK